MYSQTADLWQIAIGPFPRTSSQGLLPGIPSWNICISGSFPCYNHVFLLDLCILNLPLSSHHNKQQQHSNSNNNNNKMVSFAGAVDLVSKILGMASHLVNVGEKIAKSWAKKNSMY